MTPKTAVKMKAVVEDAVERDIASKTVCLRLSFGRFGNSKRIQSDKITVDADNKLIKAKKVLLDSKKLKAIHGADLILRRKIETLCLPFPDQAINLVPFGLVDEANQLCIEHKNKIRPALIEAFRLDYTELKEKACQRLRTNFNPKDYPPEKEMLEEFDFRFRFFYMGVPEVLRGLNMAIFENEKLKASEDMKEAREEITMVLRSSYLGLVNKLKESLELTSDGKQRRLHESTVDKFMEFFRTFDFRNVNDDQELKLEVDRARNLLKGVSVEELRTTEVLREKVGLEMDKISKKLEPLIEVRGRKFRD